MIVPASLLVGATASLSAHSWLPIVGALVISLIVHEVMLYDIHRHLLNLEGE